MTVVVIAQQMGKSIAGVDPGVESEQELWSSNQIDLCNNARRIVKRDEASIVAFNNNCWNIDISFFFKSNLLITVK